MGDFLKDLKALLLARDPRFHTFLRDQTLSAQNLSELLALSTLRKRALAQSLELHLSKKIRLALVGGYSFHPFADALAQNLFAEGFESDFFLGPFDSAESESFATGTELEQFRPDVVCLFPSRKYQGISGDAFAESQQTATQLLALGERFHQKTGAPVVMNNFSLPAHIDSLWNFRKWVNLELTTRAPAYIQICDLEFLSARLGTLQAEDPRAWYESKQLGSVEFLFEVVKELSWQVRSSTRVAKKVLVLDADDTLWGGVVAEEGVDGIELGDTTPRGEAFKDFQKYVFALKSQGTLLAVCSKNDSDILLEVLDTHPEMVLRRSDFVSVIVGWQPKSEGLKQIASDLNLGLDSFVFVDDNPAEIELIRQQTPEVLAVLLGSDPALYIRQLQDTRAFEQPQLTGEDTLRTELYHAESRRKKSRAEAHNLDEYLASLKMVGVFSAFNSLDVPRITQLINKTNQFNLTTRRRSEAEVRALSQSAHHECFSVRLEDRFGDYGLIGVVILERRGKSLFIDTWCLSCRVLQRQVEQPILSHIVECARQWKCNEVVGQYIPTKKNSLVANLYPNLGFKGDPGAEGHFRLSIDQFAPLPTFLTVRSPLNDSSGSPKSIAEHL